MGSIRHRRYDSHPDRPAGQRRRRRRPRLSAPAASSDDAATVRRRQPSRPTLRRRRNVVADAPYSTDAIQAAQDECYKIAFGVKSFDYQIFGEHAAVLDRVSESADAVRPSARLFPAPADAAAEAHAGAERHGKHAAHAGQPDRRRSRARGQRAAAGEQRLYRTSREPVDSLDRAVQTLGIDGLRGLMAVAILQPVFRLPRGYFDNFADVRGNRRSAAPPPRRATRRQRALRIRSSRSCSACSARSRASCCSA